MAAPQKYLSSVNAIEHFLPIKISNATTAGIQGWESWNVHAGLICCQAHSNTAFRIFLRELTHIQTAFSQVACYRHPPTCCSPVCESFDLSHFLQKQKRSESMWMKLDQETIVIEKELLAGNLKVSSGDFAIEFDAPVLTDRDRCAIWKHVEVQ